FDLGRRFDAVVLAGNVMIFVAPGTEGDVISTCARHLAPGGALVAGFQLQDGRLDMATYDRLAGAAGVSLAARFAAWGCRAFAIGDDTGDDTGDYAVSVHRAP